VTLRDVDGHSAEEVERDFVAHLAECPGCERYLDQFRTTIAELGELPPDRLHCAKLAQCKR